MTSRVLTTTGSFLLDGRNFLRDVVERERRRDRHRSLSGSVDRRIPGERAQSLLPFFPIFLFIERPTLASR